MEISKHKPFIFLNILIVLMAFDSELHSQNSGSTNLKGAYLGQKAPGKTPEVFAKGIISAGRNNHSHPAFSADGNEVFWSIYTNEYNEGNLFFHMKEQNGQWTQPAMSEDSKTYDDGSPFVSMDGNRVYFFSDRPTPESDSTWHIQMDFDIWYLQKEESGWSEPKWLKSLANTKEHWEFDLCEIKDGSFYFTRSNIETAANVSNFGIAKSTFVNGRHTTPVVLGRQFNDGNLNWSPYVDPDETYMIFSSNRGNPAAGNRGCDLYISFRNENGSWTDPVNMGPNINTDDAIERFPYVSPNGRYLFFIRGYGDVYWVDASVIDDIRSK